MIIFKKNKCRLCRKVFCCIKCRKKHEKIIHNVNPDCDICFYGEIIFKNPSGDIIEHIKTQHWPLRCRMCKRVFGSIDELILHNLCPINKKSFNDNSNITPVRPGVLAENKSDMKFDSPPVMYPFGDASVNTNIMISVTNNILAVTTSTPMQGGGFIGKMPEALTPVEPTKKDIGTDSLPEIGDTSKGSVSINRKVTFNETQLTETLGKNSNRKTHNHPKGALKKIIDKNKLENTSDELPNDTIEIWQTAISEASQISGKSILGDITNKLDSPDKRDCEISYPIENITGRDDLYEVQKFSTAWNSMASIVKGILSGFSSLSSHSKENILTTKRRLSNKRLRSDTDIIEDPHCFKKMKFTDIKCRKPINTITPYKFFLGKKETEVCHKATQTGE
ncbi:hypothetical protein Trydic_g14408 [Trypoxylus dichotomus]